MLIVPVGVKVHLALGYTDMRKGMDGVAMLVQETLKKDPFSGHVFAFRGKIASMLKILFWDGNGLCLRKRSSVRRPLGHKYLSLRGSFCHCLPIPHSRRSLEAVQLSNGSDIRLVPNRRRLASDIKR